MANAMNQEWIPLMDYAMKTGISLSTLRRHIKANKIVYKVENGRYLLRSDEAPLAAPSPKPVIIPAKSAAPVAAPTNAPTPATQAAYAEIQKLRFQLQAAQEEIAELKMLVAIYEEQTAQPKARPGQPRVNG